jgi:hypothetical protein
MARSGSGWVQHAASSSELEALRKKLSHGLASSYGWQPAQATVFLLTGSVPILPSLRTRTIRRVASPASRIILEVDPTVTPREVEQHYTRARRRLMGGRRFRRISEKHLRLAVFADAHRDGTWSDRMCAWNREFPDDRYANVRNFQRDAAGALRRLLRSPLDGEPE